LVPDRLCVGLTTSTNDDLSIRHLGGEVLRNLVPRHRQGRRRTVDAMAVGGPPRWRRAWLVGIAAVLGGLAIPTPASADATADGQRLAFATSRFGDGEIMTMGGDGSGLARVTRWGPLASDEAAATTSSPQWSPDGRSILFSGSGVNPPFEAGSMIDEIAEDGTDRHTLQSGGQFGFEGSSVGSPTWSPDGSRYLYRWSDFSRTGSTSSLIVSGVGGIDGVFTRFGGGFAGTDFSPDGTRVVAVRSTSGPGEVVVTELVVYDLAGETSEAIVDASKAAVDWSPDGSRIAFVRNGEVRVVDPDGTDDVALTTGSNPQWSPDGQQILFSRPVGGTADIFVMDADGTDVSQLTTATGDDVEATWSPDGTTVAFVSSRDGNTEIYVMAADGSGQTNLTQSPGADRNPDWTAGCAEADCGEPEDSPTVPSAVDVVSAVVEHPDLTIDFGLPTENGGSRVTGYTVTQRPSGETATVSGPEGSFHGVVFGTRTVSLAATNALGDGPSDEHAVVCADVLEPHGFNDVPSSVEAAASWLWDRAIAVGYADDTFRPGRPVTRAQLVAMLYRVAGSPDVTGLEHGLTDVPAAIDGPVRWAVSAEVMGGFADGTFRPRRNEARGPLATTLHHLAGSPDPAAYGDSGLIDVPPALDGAVRWLVGSGTGTGFADHTYRPKATATRGQLANVLFRGVCGPPT
jgi:Tol biopolymer transport system component